MGNHNIQTVAVKTFHRFREKGEDFQKYNLNEQEKRKDVFAFQSQFLKCKYNQEDNLLNPVLDTIFIS